MKKILIALLGIGIFLSTVLAYELSDRDYDALDAVEDRLFDLMEDRSWDADYMVSTIQLFMSNKRLTEKSNALLIQLIDDIDYYRSGDQENEIERYMTEEDCYEDEYFDTEEDWCYPLEDSDLDYSNNDFHTDHESQEMSVLSAYLLSDDDMLIQVDGDSDPKHQEIWNWFATLIPASVRKDLHSVNFANDTNSDTAAYVAQTDEHHEKWKIVFNVDAYYLDGVFDTKESTHTNIHEFAHILTLGKTQAQLISVFADNKTIDRYETSCLTYFLPEGCLLRTSYFKAFIDTFWDEDELKTAREKGKKDKFSPSEYVSEYASTNPGEDIAESFTHFVLKSKPVGITEAQRKVQFFYDYPELVKLRSFIRSRLK